LINQLASNVERSGNKAVFHLRSLSAAFFAVSLVAYFFWIPYAVKRRRFGAELDRFLLRIQGLASKAELAELALAESRVVDERTLRAFIDHARTIANRHGVGELVSPFDLWASAAPRSEPART
jgi:hypothetical protein